MMPIGVCLTALVLVSRFSLHHMVLPGLHASKSLEVSMLAGYVKQ